MFKSASPARNVPKAHIAPKATSLRKQHRVIGTSLLQGVPSGRLPRRFASRNDIRCVARKSIKSARKFYYYFPANKPLLRSVRSTLSLRAQRGNLPEGLPYKLSERETNSLTSSGFSGILALRVSRTVASQDEESPSITRQGAGEIPVKATSRKVQQRYTARFIV